MIKAKTLVKRLFAAGLRAFPDRMLAYAVAEYCARAPHRLDAAANAATLAMMIRHFDVDCVFDVGANAGQYAALLRGPVGFKGPIVMFEPLPKQAEKLREHARADPNLHVEQVALSAAAGEGAFNRMEVSMLSSLRHPTDAETRKLSGVNAVAETLPVRIETLDGVFARLQEEIGFRRPFLKLDTQGSDMDVIADGARVLPSFAGIQSELAFRRIYEGAPGYREAIDGLAERGFDLAAMHPVNAHFFPELIEFDGVFVNARLRDALAGRPGSAG